MLVDRAHRGDRRAPGGRPGGRPGAGCLRTGPRSLARGRPARHGRPGVGPRRDDAAHAGRGRPAQRPAHQTVRRARRGLPAALDAARPVAGRRSTKRGGNGGRVPDGWVRSGVRGDLSGGDGMRSESIGAGMAELSDHAIKSRIVDDLTRARRRTALLTEAVDDDDLIRQHSRLMSPLVWDLAHIGNHEELWLLRDVGGKEPILPETVDKLYDAFQHPRADRPALPLLDPASSRKYVGEVRSKVIDLLERTPLHGRHLTEGGFVFGMIAQHEQQHAETMLATHQLRRGDPVLTAPPPPAPPDTPLPAEVLVPGGGFTMGTSAHPWALDNERPAHQVQVPAFWMDTVPVTNGDYQRFIAAGGYDDPRWWQPIGWHHRITADLTAPLFWQRDGREWLRRRFSRLEVV